MNPLFSLILMTLIILTAMGMVISIGTPIIERNKLSSSFNEAEMAMEKINHCIDHVISEGNGSSRKFDTGSFGGEFEMRDYENSITYSIRGPRIFEYLSRAYRNGYYVISGNDVDCYESGSLLVMENSRIAFYFRLVGSPSLPSSIDTSVHLNKTVQKDYGTELYFMSSTIMIDDMLSSSNGTGYSELMNPGEKMPACVFHMHIEPSSYPAYEVYYILFAGADYAIMEVSGIPYSKAIATSFATHINSTDTIRINETSVLSTDSVDQTYNPENKFVSSQSNGTVFSVVHAGKYFKNISVNTSYPDDDYIFRIRQGSEGNRLLVSFTNGTWENIDARILEVESNNLVGTSFGNFSLQSSENSQTSIFLFYKDANLTRSERWKANGQKITAVNTGRISNITNIEIGIS